MQKLSHEQGEAIIDLLQQCRVVQSAWEQRQAYRAYGMNCLEGHRLRAVRSEVEGAYKDALYSLTDLYVGCNNLGVDDEVLVGVLNSNLPQELTQTLTISPPPIAA